MRTFKIVDFPLPAVNRMKLKENKMKDKYLERAKNLRKLWNMKVKIIPIAIGVLGTATERLLEGLEDLEITGQVVTIQPTKFLRPARILRRVLETWRD